MHVRAIAAATALMGLSMGMAHAQVSDETVSVPTTTVTQPAMRTTTPGLVVVAPGSAAGQAATIGALTAAQAPTPYGQNGSTQSNGQNNTPEARADRNNTKLQQASTASSTPPNAFQQGFGDAGAVDAQRALDDFKEYHSARQQGRQVKLPMPANPVASQPELGAWLANWKDVLSTAGVDDRRINFEASRLNEDEFARWASRLVRANDPSLDEVTARPMDTANENAQPMPDAPEASAE